MPEIRSFPFTAYRGEIGYGDSWLPIRFQVASGADGELRFLVRPLPYDSPTVGLQRAWDSRLQSAPFFKLRGTSRQGTRFESDHITITRMDRMTTQTRTTVTLRLKCSKGRFVSEPDFASEAATTAPAPYLRFLLRRFEAFPHLEAECPLGKVAMEGKYPGPKNERLSGVLQITPTATCADFAAWRNDAEALCLHLQRYMSFAQGRMIRAPGQEVWDGQTYEQIAWSQSRQTRRSQEVIHPMTQQAYFEKAVKAFFAPPIAIQNATYALEWFAMDASYTEIRLLNAMTALENLTNSNLATGMTTYVGDRRFANIAKAMRAAAREFVAENPSVAEDGGADAALLDGLAGKMRDLNRRPLKAKIGMLAAHWGVPLSDLIVGDGLSKAISARDAIIHRGWYYEPAEGTAEQRDLWDHVLLMREIVIRFILTTIAYEGTYISFRGGQHDVLFPPAAP